MMSDCTDNVYTCGKMLQIQYSQNTYRRNVLVSKKTSNRISNMITLKLICPQNQNIYIHLIKYLLETGTITNHLIWKTIKNYGITSRHMALKQNFSKQNGTLFGPIMEQVLMDIMLTNLSSIYERQHRMNCFVYRTGKGCNVGISTIKLLREYAYLFNTKRITSFFAIRAVYDLFYRDYLF